MAACEPINNPATPTPNPPSMAFVALAIGVLPLRVSLSLWAIVNTAALVTTAYFAWRLNFDDAPPEAGRRKVAAMGGGTWLAIALDHLPVGAPAVRFSPSRHF